MVIPIQIEGGGGRSSQRKGSDAVFRKPLRKKNSRQKCRTFNIEIELEGLSGKHTAERKNGISSKGKGSVTVPTKKITRRTSSKDLRGVIRRQSSKDLRAGLMRRQSSRDLVTNISHRVMGGQSQGDVCVPCMDDRFTIRRDSINGLRIVSKLDQSEAEALDGLGEIALTEEKEEFSKFQTDALKTHNKYRARHGVRPLTLSTELNTRAQQYADTLAASERTSTGAGAVTLPGGVEDRSLWSVGMKRATGTGTRGSQGTPRLDTSPSWSGLTLLCWGWG